MNKTINITVDVTKLDKTKFEDREYTNKAGETVKEKNVKLDVIPLREYRIIKTGDGWEMRKTHFVKQSPSKEEKANKVELPIIGSGIQFMNDDETPLTGEGLKQVLDYKNKNVVESDPF